MDGTAQIRPAELGERCPRCKQVLDTPARRCSNCGQPISGSGRKLTLWIGVGGVAALLFLVALMWVVVLNEDVMKAPVPVDEQTAARQQEILPETSKEADKAPAQPEKAPPLNK